MHAARVAALFLAQLQSTHRAQRSSARVFRGHALREELLGLALEVILKLFVEFPLDAMAAEERAQPQWNRVDPMFEAHRILPVRTPAGIDAKAHGRFTSSHSLATRRGERPWGRPAWRGAPGSSTPPAPPGQARRKRRQT